MKISFIGAGSMAEAIIAGLIEKNICRGEDVFVTNREDREKLEQLERRYGIQPTYDMEGLFQGADMVIFAVKPKDADSALLKIQPYIQEDTFFISVMAGISIAFIEEKLKAECAVARAMPNTSASVGKSATAVSFNQRVSDNQKELAATVFSSIGITAVVEETKLDAITALSGSGPAYIYYVVEAMEKSAWEIGLDSNMAKQLILQTLAGAVEMLSSSDCEAAELRKAVTSPGGTTEAGIKVLQQNNVEEAFIQCIKAAAEQSKRLGQIHESKHLV
ncbi:pyrroline-5-carboxylate reductase [Siminovitchia terrae]|uniref:Pyrroline-5-carboxylate reductase n=1 Tax=Siminovitchia terrae TaxID=1914933 RepID=A0A429XD49_SIMTE|nr:pyrroline-5-carboxylate reductase [Siminovitchia terrae]RST61374.1 pyrroline-5-carboxylate reductase [Siminovitchia terrae]GIN96434.1 pyrroline-5-carboxylate reductase [Siminovitchia terrae]